MESLYKVKFLIEHPNPLKLRNIMDLLLRKYDEKAVKIGGSLIIADDYGDNKTYLVKITVPREEARTIEGLILPTMRGIVVTIESTNPAILSSVLKDIIDTVKSSEPEVLISLLE